MLHNVALPAEVVGGSSNVIIGISAGPDTESVVMFGNEDYFSESGFLEKTYPLVGVYLSVGGVEGGAGRFVSLPHSIPSVLAKVFIPKWINPASGFWRYFICRALGAGP